MLCSVGSLEMVVHWRCNCFAKSVPLVLKQLNGVHPVEKILTTALLILCSLKCYTYHKAFPSVLSSSSNLFFFSLFDHLHSLRIVQTHQFFLLNIHYWAKAKYVLFFFFFLQAECRHVVQHLRPNHCPLFLIMIHVAKLKMTQYNDRVKPANLWKDYQFAMCKFECIYNGSIDILMYLYSLLSCMASAHLWLLIPFIPI